jgi:hypothetical protein
MALLLPCYYTISRLTATLRAVGLKLVGYYVDRIALLPCLYAITLGRTWPHGDTRATMQYVSAILLSLFQLFLSFFDFDLLRSVFLRSVLSLCFLIGTFP